MTTISAATTFPSYYYPTLNTSGGAGAASTSLADTPSGSSGATNLTLSSAALAAMNQPDFATVTVQARAALDALIANGTKPADADLGSLDRRRLFAIASNAGSQFTADEQAAAKTEMQRRLDAALAGPLAVAHVTDDLEAMYVAAQNYLDGASGEEKATSGWQSQKDAVTRAQQQLAADPSKAPDVPGDIVADYVGRADAGATGDARSFSDVASDARAALDAQYASARASGKTLTFFPGDGSASRSGQPADFSKFDSRSVAAIALNQDGKFSPEEVLAAKHEIGRRSDAAVSAGLRSAGTTPGAFAKNLLSAYASMSPEERQAAGWSEQLYAAAVASYKSASRISSLLSGAGGSGTNAAGLLGGTASSNPLTAGAAGTGTLASLLGTNADPGTLALLLGSAGNSSSPAASLLNRSLTGNSSSGGGMSLADLLNASGN